MSTRLGDVYVISAVSCPIPLLLALCSNLNLIPRYFTAKNLRSTTISVYPRIVRSRNRLIISGKSTYQNLSRSASTALPLVRLWLERPKNPQNPIIEAGALWWKQRAIIEHCPAIAYNLRPVASAPCCTRKENGNPCTLALKPFLSLIYILILPPLIRERFFAKK